MITDKELDELTNNKSLLKFSWPPKFSYPFKKQRKYKHEVVVVSQRNPDWADVYIYTNEPDAKKTRDMLRKATNNISVEYEKTEIPVTVEEGFIT